MIHSRRQSSKAENNGTVCTKGQSWASPLRRCQCSELSQSSYAQFHRRSSTELVMRSPGFSPIQPPSYKMIRYKPRQPVRDRSADTVSRHQAARTGRSRHRADRAAMAARRVFKLAICNATPAQSRKTPPNKTGHQATVIPRAA